MRRPIHSCWPPSSVFHYTIIELDDQKQTWKSDQNVPCISFGHVFHLSYVFIYTVYQCFNTILNWLNDSYKVIYKTKGPLNLFLLVLVFDSVTSLHFYIDTTIFIQSFLCYIIVLLSYFAVVKRLKFNFPRKMSGKKEVPILYASPIWLNSPF